MGLLTRPRNGTRTRLARTSEIFKGPSLSLLSLAVPALREHVAFFAGRARVRVRLAGTGFRYDSRV